MKGESVHWTGLLGTVSLNELRIPFFEYEFLIATQSKNDIIVRANLETFKQYFLENIAVKYHPVIIPREISLALTKS
jgi:hypothetical protein